MLPIFLNLQFLKIYTFGVFLVLAFFWSTYLLWKNFRLTAIKEELVFDGLFISMVGGLFFGRLYYVLLNFDAFGINILKFILINGYPGISLWGAVVGGLATLFVFLRYQKIEFFSVIDYFISPLFIALGFGKLGSFFAGSEIGTETKFFLALKYAGHPGFRHLTAFYEAIFFFIGAYVSYRILFAIRREKMREGSGFFFFAIYFPLVYFLFDNLKGDRLYLLGQSFNRLFSLVFLIFTLIFLVVEYRDLLLKKLFSVRNSQANHGKEARQTVYSRPAEEASGTEDSAN